MFHRQLADITVLHWRTHIRDYLDEQEKVAGTLKLMTPVTFTRASYVGGVWQFSNTPHYALDCQRKEISDTNESLNTYNYSGQLTAVIGAKTADDSDDAASYHEAAAEKFIKEHLHLKESHSEFELEAFAMGESEFSGAIQVSKDPRKPFWIHAFRISLFWLVSEDAPRQHDA